MSPFCKWPVACKLYCGMERTYIMVKPDGVRRGLTGEIINRIERKGFKIVAMKKMLIPRATAEIHYGEHQGKPFFEGLVNFITSGPVVAMVVEGPGAIAEMRRLMGATRPWEAAPGTIRADLPPLWTRTSSTARTAPRAPPVRSGSSSSPKKLSASAAVGACPSRRWWVRAGP